MPIIVIKPHLLAREYPFVRKAGDWLLYRVKFFTHIIKVNNVPLSRRETSKLTLSHSPGKLGWYTSSSYIGAQKLLTQNHAARNS